MMMKMRMSVICFVIAIGVLSIVLLQNGSAETSVPGEAARTVNEESTARIEDALCENPAPCCPAMKESSSNSNGGFIGGFLAFGSRVNYWLTGWILGDKRDIEMRQCDESQCPIRKR